MIKYASVLGLALAVPSFVGAATLSPDQVKAITSLLQSFNSDQTTVTCVQASLSGGPIPDTCGDLPPARGSGGAGAPGVPTSPPPVPAGNAPSLQGPTTSVPTGIPSGTVQMPPAQSGGPGMQGFMHRFMHDLSGGDRGAEIKALQEALKSDDVFTGTTTEKFGAKTQAAVRAFQKKHGLSPTGMVGPKTRAKLNELFGK